MNCPSCADTALLLSERQGVEIDYCPRCRGVWLDRGELDKLIEWVGQFARDGVVPVPAHEGEHLFAVERLVVSPAAGVFTRSAAVADGGSIVVGQVIGLIGDIEVRSPFAGALQSFIAVDGERVTAHQPIAWLRSQ